jgi:hypothetical protein
MKTHLLAPAVVFALTGCGIIQSHEPKTEFDRAVATCERLHPNYDSWSANKKADCVENEKQGQKRLQELREDS